MSRNGRTLAMVRGHFVHVLDLEAAGEAELSSSGAGLQGETGRLLSRFHGQRASELLPDISPDGRWVATGTWQGTGVRVWNARTGRQVTELPVTGSAHPVFSPDGRWLATATGGETQLWRVGDWKSELVLRQTEPEGVPSTLAFSPDGSILASPYSRSVVRLVEVDTGREIARLRAPNAHRAYPLCFSPDGRLLVTKGGPELIHVWDLPLIRRQLAAMGLEWRQPSAAMKPTLSRAAPAPPSARRGTPSRLRAPGR
jgi:WD40 repeat protein